jgi:uncharacterized protein YecE (DUF72 family)
MNSWINKGKGKKDCKYSLKVPQLVTIKLSWRDKAKGIFLGHFLWRTCVKPLADEGLLDDVLFQLPTYFKKKALPRQLKACARCCFSSGDQLSSGAQAQ